MIGLNLLSCINEKPTRFDHTTPEIDSTLQSTYRGEDRHIWQRPDFVISKIGSVNGKVVADLGAGSGYFAFRFLKNGASVIAIDIDTSMIALMNGEVNFLPDSLEQRFEARMAEPDNPKLADEEIDLLFISNTYPYISDRIKYFSRIKSAFKDGGKMMIVDFKKKHTPIGPPQQDRMALGQIEEELIKAGYNILQSDDASLSYQYILIATPN